MSSKNPENQASSEDSSASSSTLDGETGQIQDVSEEDVINPEQVLTIKDGVILGEGGKPLHRFLQRRAKRCA